MMETPRQLAASLPPARSEHPTPIVPAVSAPNDAARDSGSRLLPREAGADIAAETHVVHAEPLREILERIVMPPWPGPAPIQPHVAMSSLKEIEPSSAQRAPEAAESPRREPDQEPVLDAAPVTNIHIGRVELTSVAPLPRRAPGTPVKPPMSLDEYLRRRDGRAR